MKLARPKKFHYPRFTSRFLSTAVVSSISVFFNSLGDSRFLRFDLFGVRFVNHRVSGVVKTIYAVHNDLYFEFSVYYEFIRTGW
jgi:hypothetical protein